MKNKVNTFPIKAGIGVDFTKEAKVLLIRDASTTVLHWQLRIPNLEDFRDLTHAISPALNSGTKFCTNLNTMSIKMGWSIEVGFSTPVE